MFPTLAKKMLHNLKDNKEKKWNKHINDFLEFHYSISMLRYWLKIRDENRFAHQPQW
jgi:hypothetical protein